MPTSTKSGHTEVSDHLITGAAKAAVEQAKKGQVQVTINHVPGEPFKVINLGAGKLAWGVGGGGGSAIGHGGVQE
jgi:hypothetical protein